MTGETIRELLQPLIGKAGAISMVVSRTGHVGFVTTENEKLPAWGFARTSWCVWSVRPGGP
jgi:hypothetical protein